MIANWVGAVYAVSVCFENSFALCTYTAGEYRNSVRTLAECTYTRQTKEEQKRRAEGWLEKWRSNVLITTHLDYELETERERERRRRVECIYTGFKDITKASVCVLYVRLTVRTKYTLITSTVFTVYNTVFTSALSHNI